jgi:hypothetical protein
MLGGLANLVLILGTIKVLSDWMAVSLGDHQQQRVRLFLERWQLALNDASLGAFFAILLSAIDHTYARVLGPRPFSRQAFRRTCIFGSLFLGASLGFVGLFCDKPFGMNAPPWESFFASLQYLQTAVATASRAQVGDPFHFIENASDLARLGSWPFAVGYTIYFVVIVVFSTAFLLSVSVAVSRLVLREMISARTGFRVFLLFFSNTVLLFVFGATASLALLVLLNIWTWPFLPVFFAISKLSLMAGAGMASGASLLFLFLSAPWLRVVLVLSLFPSIVVVLVVGVALIWFPFRHGFYAVAHHALRLSLRSPKGVFSFLSASSMVLALLLAFSASFFAWLARLSLTVGSPSLFGFDSLVLATFVFLLMLLLSLGRARTFRLSCISSLAWAEVMFLFFGAICVIASGYYVQAILECSLNVGAALVADRDATLAAPALSAVIPGSVVGYVIVASRLAGASWVKAAVRIFLVLAASDMFLGILGLVSFRDSLVSVFCDLLGCPFAGYLIFKADRLFFPASREPGLVVASRKITLFS